jgi:hypothetical protein
MVIASILRGQENRSYSVNGFFAKEDNKIVCKNCKSINSPYYFDKRMSLENKKLDFSSTYEGAIIVSERFKSYCIEKLVNNVLFLPLEEVSGFFYFYVLGKYVQLDQEKSDIKMKEICIECGYNKEVYGGLKIFLKNSSELAQGFHLTDIFWRSHYVFTQNIVVDLQTKKDLKDQKFKGLLFENVYS